MLTCALLPVHLFWWARFRRSPLTLALVGALVAVGAYADHVMVLVVTLSHDFLPSSAPRLPGRALGRRDLRGLRRDVPRPAAPVPARPAGGLDHGPARSVRNPGGREPGPGRGTREHPGRRVPGRHAGLGRQRGVRHPGGPRRRHARARAPAPPPRRGRAPRRLRPPADARCPEGPGPAAPLDPPLRPRGGARRRRGLLRDVRLRHGLRLRPRCRRAPALLLALLRGAERLLRHAERDARRARRVPVREPPAAPQPSGLQHPPISGAPTRDRYFLAAEARGPGFDAERIARQLADLPEGAGRPLAIRRVPR